MEKKTIFALAVVAVLVLGAVFVSADSEELTHADEDVKEPEPSQQICGPSSCGGNCRGGCGISSCGCRG